MKLPTNILLLFTSSLVFAEEMPGGHPPIDHSTIFEQAEQVTQEDATLRQSEVKNVLDTRGYTYIEVEQDDQKVWLAVPTTEVKTGDSVRYKDGPVVLNHTSRTLDRTFTSVIFLSNVIVKTAE